MELTAAEEFGELRNVIPGVLQNEACEITSDASKIELGQDLGAILGISMLIVINRIRTGKQKIRKPFFHLEDFQNGYVCKLASGTHGQRRFCLSDRER